MVLISGLIGSSHIGVLMSQHRRPWLRSGTGPGVGRRLLPGEAVSPVTGQPYPGRTQGTGGRGLLSGELCFSRRTGIRSTGTGHAVVC